MTKQLTVAKTGDILPAEPRLGNVRILKRESMPLAGGSARQVQNRSYDYEDDFAGMYDLGNNGNISNQILSPPFNPRTLESLVQQNNTLPVCIDAMVTNVHCSGFDIIPRKEGDNHTADHDAIDDFFDTTFPGQGFIELRKEIGYDLERVGYFYMEFLRNRLGQLIFLKRLDPKTMRLVRLDEPQAVDLEVNRGGKVFTARTEMRYRRFAQQINGRNVRYFKEYGCKADLNARTGEWAKIDEILSNDDVASEILYYAPVLDSLTPYGIPKWMPQIASVLGSRKAEEFNLGFFDNGGVPPIMIFVHGGQLAESAADALRDHLQAGPRNRHAIPVIEAMATGGSLDGGAGSVKVTVERFGSERQSDSMFEKYDARCEKRVRSAWRLPSIFVGADDNFSFATALASVSGAEAGVFAPLRQAFDDLINRTIMAELDPKKKFQFRSRPVNMRDVANQLLALQTAINSGLLSRQQVAEQLNEIVNLKLRVDNTDIAMPAQMVEQTSAPAGSSKDPTGRQNGKASSKPPGGSKPQPPRPKDNIKKSAWADMSVEELADVAFEFFEHGAGGAEIMELMNHLGALNADDAGLFKQALTNVADHQLFSPALGEDFADNVCQAVLALIPEAELSQAA